MRRGKLKAVSQVDGAYELLKEETRGAVVSDAPTHGIRAALRRVCARHPRCPSTQCAYSQCGYSVVYLAGYAVVHCTGFLPLNHSALRLWCTIRQ